MELGVRRGSVRIVPYQEAWKEVFLLEKKLLTSIFGQDALAIEHIGSTAIEGLQAKPIIDIAIQVVTIEAVQVVENKLIAIGYQQLANRLEGPQRVFIKEDDTIVTHHLHIIQAGYAEWNRKLLFRNYLHAHVDARQEYEALKVSLMKLFGNNRGMYTNLKSGYINSVIEKALRENT